ncbi:MAG: hypothetical protein QME81_16620 [bacterium]|nr:hypothetical protein [bacterium]
METVLKMGLGVFSPDFTGLQPQVANCIDLGADLISYDIFGPDDTTTTMPPGPTHPR